VEDQENEIAWPAIFIVGRDGRVRWRSLAETFKVRPTSEVVLEALDHAKATKG
jgi:peroxiredoxin